MEVISRFELGGQVGAARRPIQQRHKLFSLRMESESRFPEHTGFGKTPTRLESRPARHPHGGENTVDVALVAKGVGETRVSEKRVELILRFRRDAFANGLRKRIVHGRGRIARMSERSSKRSKHRSRLLDHRRSRDVHSVHDGMTKDGEKGPHGRADFAGTGGET
jgi:hypothetical protein